jgi:hypothetical protein
MEFGNAFLDRDVKSIIELGNGGGYYSKVFYKILGDWFVWVEGSGAGVAQTLERGVPKSNIVQ